MPESQAKYPRPITVLDADSDEDVPIRSEGAIHTTWSKCPPEHTTGRSRVERHPQSTRTKWTTGISVSCFKPGVGAGVGDVVGTVQGVYRATGSKMQEDKEVRSSRTFSQ